MGRQPEIGQINKPQKIAAKWMNALNSYSMWWVLIHYSWCHHHGNLEYLREQESYLTGLLRQLAEQVGPDGQEQLLGDRFLDWPSKGNKLAVHAGLVRLRAH